MRTRAGEEVRNDFNMEMSRFIPKKIKERTVDNPEYWAYVQSEINAIASELLNDERPKNPFDMGQSYTFKFINFVAVNLIGILFVFGLLVSIVSQWLNQFGRFWYQIIKTIKCLYR